MVKFAAMFSYFILRSMTIQTKTCHGRSVKKRLPFHLKLISLDASSFSEQCNDVRLFYEHHCPYGWPKHCRRKHDVMFKKCMSSVSKQSRGHKHGEAPCFKKKTTIRKVFLQLTTIGFNWFHQTMTSITPWDGLEPNGKWLGWESGVIGQIF